MKHKIKTGIIVCLSLLLVLYVYLISHMLFGIQMYPKSYYQSYTFEVSCDVPGNEEIKVKIDKLFDIYYIYKEKNLAADTFGKSSPLFRVVVIDKDIYGYDYAMTLAHELVHIRDMTLNECWTEYQAIIMLYESDDVFLQDTAKYWIRVILNGGYYGTDYDCSQYIYNYLIRKG